MGKCKGLIKSEKLNTTLQRSSFSLFTFFQAACTASGKVMIWEAEDIMALENWNSPPSGPIDASSHRLSSLTWSTNRFNLPLMVVASDELNIPITAKVIVFMFSPNAGFGYDDVND